MQYDETQRSFPSSDLLWDLPPQVHPCSNGRALWCHSSANQGAALVFFVCSRRGLAFWWVSLMVLNTFEWCARVFMSAEAFLLSLETRLVTKRREDYKYGLVYKIEFFKYEPHYQMLTASTFGCSEPIVRKWLVSCWTVRLRLCLHGKELSMSNRILYGEIVLGYHTIIAKPKKALDLL